jgi:8-oxo-dGTP pyrophosphatase MutT (NUDIX family)
VMILLFERDHEARMVLTKRSDALVHHPGQISLPGGRYEHTDGDLLRTALRETHEEIGVAPGEVRPLGSLDEVRTAASGFVVTPFVGLLDRPLFATAHDGEVARIMEVAVRELLALDASLPEEPTLETLRYPIQGEDVWGATARIIRDFCSHVRSAIG